MSDMNGKVVLITGGAKGIGFVAAREFAKAGSTVVLTDIEGELLEKAADSIRQTGAEVHTYVVDVSDRTQVEEMANDVMEKLGRVDVLINNAGVGHTREFIDMDYKTWETLIGVNFWGPMYHIYAFLPHMIERGEGHIVNVSSGQVYFRLPTWGAYATSKSALGAFSETLHYELEELGIKVTTVYPFMVRDTGFYLDVDAKTWGTKMAMLFLPYYSNKPETVGRKIYKAVVKGKRVERVHLFNWVGIYMHFLPFVHDIVSRITYRFLGRPPEHFGGKKSTGRIRSFMRMTEERRIGFKMDEIMTGEHEFETGFGAPGKKFIEFRATWGPKHISPFLNPLSDSFCVCELDGTVTIEGLCEDAPMKGTLELKYFDEHKLRYTFDFSSNGTDYHFVGEKVDVRLWRFWDLPKTHTICYGELTVADTGELVSKSITHFRLRTMPGFLISCRLA